MESLKRIISTLLASALILTIPTFGISADEWPTETCGAQCPSCGSMSVNNVAYGSYSIWMDNGESPCIHGKSSTNEDINQIRFKYSSYKKCKNCGWEGTKTVVATENRLKCVTKS